MYIAKSITLTPDEVVSLIYASHSVSSPKIVGSLKLNFILRKADLKNIIFIALILSKLRDFYLKNCVGLFLFLYTYVSTMCAHFVTLKT